MLMDCCHILLGRPWHYARHVVHDGRLNQYMLWVNGKKQILFPLIEILDEVSYTTIKVCMVNGKKFENEVKKNQVCFAIVPRRPSVGSNDQVAEVGNNTMTTKIVELLDEYKDIITDDIPNGLPLVRSISHCMDLIPRASFSNKAPYRLIPTKNEELNRKVHEFL